MHINEAEPIVGLVQRDIVGLVGNVVVHTKTTGGAGVIVVEEVHSHSRTRSSLLMRSIRSWVDWNMLKVESNEMKMSAP